MNGGREKEKGQTQERRKETETIVFDAQSNAYSHIRELEVARKRETESERQGK